MTGQRTIHLICAVAVLGFSSSQRQEEPSAAATSSQAEGASVAIVFHRSPVSEHFGTVAVNGLPEGALATLRQQSLERAEWVRLFSVHTSPAGEMSLDRPAVLGSYVIEDGTIRFTPRFPFSTGMVYRGRFDGRIFDELSDHRETKTPTIELTFAMPEPKGGASTIVEAVYPTAGELPENLLRLYVYFSAPMRTKDVQNHVHLYDSSGKEVTLPFVEIEHGLWDPRHRRLTLFFHPGRIKRGVAPNLELGPPLRQGETFRLVIDRELKDAMGYPLADGFEKEIKVGPADRRSPDHVDWAVSAPESSQGPLVIDFPEPLDYSLLHRFIVVEDTKGSAVAGRVSVSKHETRWSFLPDAPWKPGEYRIHVNPVLEDVAGNTLAYLFDEEMSGQKVEPPDELPSIEIRFRVTR